MTYYGNDGAWDSGNWSVRSGGNGTGAACSGINADLDGIAILNNTSGNRDVYQKSFPYTPNATYTASFYAKMADSCTKTSITAQLRIWNDTTGKNHSGTTKTISSKTDWTLISLTFAMPASGILAFMAGISGAGAIDMSAFQLKPGVGVTKWAPSSYDFTLNSSGIDSIEINNTTFDYVSGFKVKDTNDNTLTYIRPNGTYSITTNGLYNIATYENVTVNVPTGSTINNQNKTVAPNETQQQITADSGYTGLGTVTISPISSTYIGSSILENSSTDLIVSGRTVTAPAGYYAADASASVAEMTLPTAASSTQSGTTKATIGRSTAAQYINIPVGYNSAAASYTISAVPNGSVTAPSSISGTTATVSAETNTLTLTKTISVTPNVTTTGYISAGTAGNSSVSLTATVTTKAAATITPGTSNQTIAADTYLTGAQTISGDADLVAGNIKSGVNIFGVAGTYTSDATATAADLLYNKTAYVDGSKITGTMPNNGATGGTITTQGGTYTIPAGYTSGGTVTANLATGSTTATNISGAAFEESTGDYGFRASVQIQPGYYSSATTITKDFSTILPAPETEGTSAQVLVGYDLYNHEGQVISGTMTNNSIGTITLDQTTTSYTIPAGYHNGTGKVQHTTVDIPDPTISINSSTGVITASGSWTRGFTTDNNYSNTYNLTTLGATTYNVSTSNQTISSGRYLTGNQTIRAVTTSNITAANIKAGVIVQVGDSADADRILGVTGTFTSDANATAADINSGITAYVNGNKITGTQTFSTIHTGSSAPASSVGANGDVYLVLA